MVKAILFDFWGTLVENGTWSPLKQLKEILHIGLPFSEYITRVEKAMMTSKFVGLKDAFEAVCQEFKINPSEEQVEQLIGLWNKSWMLAKPYLDTEKELQKLAGNYQLILVSNTDCFSAPRVLTKFKMEKLFSKIYLSFEHNLLKGEDLLQKILDENNLQVEDCVFVGDSIESDVEAAKSVGMRAILIDRRDRREFEPKIKNLSELEKFL